MEKPLSAPLYQSQGFRARRKYDNFDAIFELATHFQNLCDYRARGAETPAGTEHYTGEKPMSITSADVEKIAKLARIRIDETDIAEVSQRLGNILAMADRLQAVDTSGIAPMANPLDATQRLRADVVTEPGGEAAVKARDAFLAIAPSSEDGLFLVPKVIE